MSAHWKMSIAMVVFVFTSFTHPPTEGNNPSRHVSDFINNYLSIRYPNYTFNSFIYVEVKQQRLHFIENDSLVRTYVISTGAKGLGNKQNSFKTPSGLHEISTKLGENVPVGGILKGSWYTGKLATITQDSTICKEDIVCTRAMRLRGLEKGKNAGAGIDTHNRHIYIHGTPDEGMLGKPISHGCIRMANDDVIELFDLVNTHTKVIILNL